MNAAGTHEATAQVVDRAGRVPGPPELLPGLPDAIVDLQADEGAALVCGRWRYSDAAVREIDFVQVGSAADPLGPGDIPNRTYDVEPHAEGPGFDDSSWQQLKPEDTRRRLSDGRVCFNWYRITVTLPERVGDFPVAGSSVVFEVVIDDYAEVWVNGEMPTVIGDSGGQVVSGFNAPNRVLLGHDVKPGDLFEIAVFGINGPISASPHNYIWMRTCTLDFYGPGRAATGEPAALGRLEGPVDGLDSVIAVDAELERVAGGFKFTEGPVWTRDEALLFSSPNTNVIYRYSPFTGTVSLFSAKSGYSSVDIARFVQPGSNGLTFDRDGRLTICQHGNRRVVRVESHGNVTVMADCYDGRRLNSPNDLVYRSDGTLYFTDPPFGLPETFQDRSKELPFSGVFRVRDGEIALVDDELAGPNGIAFSPDERYLYVGNWDLDAKVVKRYEVDESGDLLNGAVFFDMTDAAGEAAIDGIKVDRSGNLFVCGPGGIWVLSADGQHLGTLEIPEEPHNLAWGGRDGRTLYITALTSVYRVRLEVGGSRPGQSDA